MNWDSSIPGLIVLAVGLLGGAILAARLRRGGVQSGRGRELELVDLEGRRDEIYGKLREEDGESLGAEERESLELAAARALKRVDELASKKKASKDRRSKPEGHSPAPAPQPARAGITGFVMGVGMTALVALLVFWANRDAAPRPEDTVGPISAPAPDDVMHDRLQEMSSQGRERVGALITRLEANPGDLDARKALAETFIMEGFFVEAFEQSEVILAESPGDVDALYFQGLVRLTMGQSELARELLDQALESQPDFVSARLVRGITRLRTDDRPGALDDWRAGLTAAGDAHPGLEQLIRLAESGATMAQILGTPVREPEPQLTPAGTPIPEVQGEPYTPHLPLAPGAELPAGPLTLFVSLRGDAPGPPAAVQNIQAPAFPLDIELDERHSMLGRPLPASGTLRARIDQDGNASTTQPGDLAAEALTSRGDAVELELATLD